MIGSPTPFPYFTIQLNKMGSFRNKCSRPRFMSSPVLSDLPRFNATRQALQLSSNSAWNNVQSAVINVFKGGGLQNNELYTLNESVRRLLKSELGSFITDYFQNQLLAKGLLIMEEKVKLYEVANRMNILAELWDHYFTEILPMLQAIFYPVQGQELTIRQIALLGFRDFVVLKVKLEEVFSLEKVKILPSIVQMLLVLQSVHEPSGPSMGYLQLEELTKLAVSPYLGMQSDNHSTYVFERTIPRSHPKMNPHTYSSQIIQRHTGEPPLTPLTEHDGESYLEKCGSVRRHTVANAHSDIQLFAMATMMHTGMAEEQDSDGDQCMMLQPGLSRQCSSEPNILDSPNGLMVLSLQESGELSCTSVC